MDKKKEENELEYNDGLGDLLREKEEFEFSWAKTSIVLISVIAIIFLGLTLIFKASKSYISDTVLTYSDDTEQVDTLSTLEEENETLIKMIDTPEAQAAAQKTLTVIKNEIQPDSLSTSDTLRTSLTAPDDALLVNPKSDTPTQIQPKPTALNQSSTVSDQRKTKNHPYKVISGTFSKKSNADLLKTNLNKKKFRAYVWSETLNSGKTLYKVQAGAFSDYAVAVKQKAKLKKQGFDAYILVKN
mgnify:CR=1 FL=1